MLKIVQLECDRVIHLGVINFWGPLQPSLFTDAEEKGTCMWRLWQCHSGLPKQHGDPPLGHIGPHLGHGGLHDDLKQPFNPFHNCVELRKRTYPVTKIALYKGRDSLPFLKHIPIANYNGQ